MKNSPRDVILIQTALRQIKRPSKIDNYWPFNLDGDPIENGKGIAIALAFYQADRGNKITAFVKPNSSLLSEFNTAFNKASLSQKSYAINFQKNNSSQQLSLTQAQISAIVFNELASLDGSQFGDASEAIAHAIINGDKQLGLKRPKTAPDTINRLLSVNEQKKLMMINARVSKAILDNTAKNDPTSGAIFYNLRDANNFKKGVSAMVALPRFGMQAKLSYGPFRNTHPSKSQMLGTKDIYVLVYK